MRSGWSRRHGVLATTDLLASSRWRGILNSHPSMSAPSQRAIALPMTALRLLDDTIADRTDPKAIKLAIEGVISDMAFEVQQERLIDSESRF
jgi:hypothetical protein